MDVLLNSYFYIIENRDDEAVTLCSRVWCYQTSLVASIQK